MLSKSVGSTYKVYPEAEHISPRPLQHFDPIIILVNSNSQEVALISRHTVCSNLKSPASAERYNLRQALPMMTTEAKAARPQASISSVCTCHLCSIPSTKESHLAKYKGNSITPYLFAA